MADDHQAAARSALQFPSLVPLAVVTLAALVLVGIAERAGSPPGWQWALRSPRRLARSPSARCGSAAAGVSVPARSRAAN